MLPGVKPPVVPAWTYELTIGGLPYECDSWDIEYSLGSPLGASPVPIGRGDAAGTLTFNTDPRQLVIDGAALSPQRRGVAWPPTPGLPITCRATPDGGATWYQIIGPGIVTDASEQSTDGTTRVTITAPWDKLDEPIDESALAAQMAPPPGDDERTYRAMGNHHSWHIARGLEAAGWRDVALPPETEPALAVSLRGSVWPTAGVLLSAQVYGQANENLAATSAPGINGSARWRIGVDRDPVSVAAQTVWYYPDWTLQFVVDRAHSAIATLQLLRDTSRVCQIVVGADRSISIGDATLQTVGYVGAQLPAPPTELVTVVKIGQTLRVVRSSAAATTESTFALGSSWVGVSTVDLNSNVEAAVHTLSMRQAVSGDWSAMPGLSDMRFRVIPSPLVDRIKQTPRLESASAGDLLEKVAAATLSSYTVRQEGVLDWVAWRRWGTNAPLTITSADIFDRITRGMDLQRLASLVVVKLQTVQGGSSTPAYGTALWSGDGSQLDSGAVMETLISVPADQDWVGVDLSLTAADSGVIASKLGKGSWYGAVVDSGQKDSNNDPIESGANSSWSGSLERISYGTYKLTAANTGPKAIHQRLPTYAAVPPGWRGANMPVVQGHILMQWADAQVKRTAAAVRSEGVLTHDVGRYLVSPGSDPLAGAKVVADHLAAVSSSPVVTISDLSIVADPRIEVGDTHIVRSPEIDLDADFYITSTRFVATPGDGLQMTISGQALVTRLAGVTYSQLDDLAAKTATTYSGIDAVPTRPYSAFDTDPLEGM